MLNPRLSRSRTHARHKYVRLLVPSTNTNLIKIKVISSKVQAMNKTEKSAMNSHERWIDAYRLVEPSHMAGSIVSMGRVGGV